MGRAIAGRHFPRDFEGDLERGGAGDIADAGTEVRALALTRRRIGRPRTYSPLAAKIICWSRLASDSWLGEEMERQRRV